MPQRRRRTPDASESYGVPPGPAPDKIWRVPSPLGVELLQALSDLAANERGWMRRGVRGWAFVDELPRYALAQDTARDLAQRGFVWREDVRDPFRTNPWCLHRITQVGQNVLADATGLPHITIDSPADVLTDVEEETLFVSMDTWLGLVFLAEQEPGRWFTTNQISSASNGRFFKEDGKYLLTRGLIVLEGEPDQLGSPKRFQATDLGKRARKLDTTASDTRVAIHIPGLREAARGGSLNGRRQSFGSISGG